ncbi:MAG: DNA-protecting protein DprA, partial [Gemmatimonadales bacterium]
MALALAPGIGATRLKALIDGFVCGLGAVSAPSALLCRVPGISPACATAIKEASPAQGADILARLESLRGNCLLPGDPRFPSVLADIPEPPQLLF